MLVRIARCALHDWNATPRVGAWLTAGLIIGCLLQPTVNAQSPSITFDAPAIAIAQSLDPAVSNYALAGGKLIRLRFPVSTYGSPGFRGVVDEYAVEIESPHQSLRMVDLWPSQEAYSEIEGTIRVENSEQSELDLGFKAGAAFAPIGQASASGSYQQRGSTKEQFQRKPPMQMLTSSGTIRRGFGCFFKFRPGPYADLEGSREIAILAEVPNNWRADMLRVTMRAVGRRSEHSRQRETLHTTTLWVTLHQEGDQSASARVRRFLQRERELRGLATAQRSQISETSLPTVWHKLGAALDVIEPHLPANYIHQVIFGPTDQYLDGKAHRLPMELRIAILDYWEERDALIALAFGTPSAASENPAPRLVDISKR